ncbi:MAG: hypothetical protein OXF02_03450 [Simkaniaceae bacterium]|nr:hypothetical protein [Simkaniaceae bacterium]
MPMVEHINRLPVIAHQPAPVVAHQPAPVVAHQPVPGGANQQNVGDVVLAPAVATNNVAQGRWRGCNCGGRGGKRASIAIGAVVGEAVLGVGWAAGTALGGKAIATQVGATVAVIDGIAVGAIVSGGLGASLAALATLGCYVAAR